MFTETFTVEENYYMVINSYPRILKHRTKELYKDYMRLLLLIKIQQETKIIADLLKTQKM